MLILYLKIQCGISQIWCYQIYLVIPTTCRFPDVVMSDHPSSLLLPPTSTPIPSSVFYSQSTSNRPVTPPQKTKKNVSIPTSTPILNKTSGNHSYASETHDRDSANYCLAQEISDYFLGAMPPQNFLNRFLPTSKGTPECPNSEGTFMSVSMDPWNY